MYATKQVLLCLALLPAVANAMGGLDIEPSSAGFAVAASMIGDESKAGKKCGPAIPWKTNGDNANRVVDLRGGLATLSACKTACLDDAACVAFSMGTMPTPAPGASSGEWCIGCNVPLVEPHPAQYDQPIAYVRVTVTA